MCCWLSWWSVSHISTSNLAQLITQLKKIKSHLETTTLTEGNKCLALGIYGHSLWVFPSANVSLMHWCFTLFFFLFFVFFILWYIERSGVMLVTQFPLKKQPKLKSKDIKYQWMEKSLRTEPSLTWTVWGYRPHYQPRDQNDLGRLILQRQTVGVSGLSLVSVQNQHGGWETGE